MLEQRTAQESRQLLMDNKEKLLSLMDEAIQFYADDESKKAAFQSLRQNIIDGEFYISVVGEFSAGKSTLLNALMGENILPSFSSETTASLNFLRHRSKAENGEYGKVYYKDGKCLVLNKEDLGHLDQYVSTRNDKAVQELDHVDLFLDSPFLENGVVLVDSPGLNGIAKGHRELTENQILRSHAGIFVFNSDHPGSKTDFEVVRYLQSKVNTIMFVLNKIDVIRESEGETVADVIDTLKESYKKQLPEETSIPEIWPVSAGKALDMSLGKIDKDDKRWGITAFENRLLKFISCGEKTHQEMITPIQKVLSICAESKRNWEDKIQVLEGKVDTAELENQISAVKSVIDGLEHQIWTGRREITKEVKETFRNTREELIAKITRLQEKKIQEIGEYESLDDMTDYLENFKRSFVGKVVSEFIPDEEERLKEDVLRIASQHYASEMDRIQEKIDSAETEIDFNVSSDLKIDTSAVELGLKEMDEKTRILENQLDELKKEENDTEENYFAARARERERDQIILELQRLEDSRDTLESKLLPSIRYGIKECPEDVSRGGVLGFLGDFLFGKKQIMTPHETVDDAEHNKAQKKQEEDLAEIDRQIREKQEELKQYRDVDSEFLDHKRMKKMKEKEEIIMKLERQSRENNEQIERRYNHAIERRKRELSNFCDELTEELTTQTRKGLRSLEDTYTNMIMNIIEAKVKADMEDKKKHLHNLQKQIQQSEQEKEQKLAEAHKKVEQLNGILDKAVDMESEFDSQETDQIERIEL